MISIIIWHHSLTCFVIKSCFWLPKKKSSSLWIVVSRCVAFAATLNPDKLTHSLHNWYCSSFLKGKDEQRTVSGSPGVTHTSTQSSSSSRMTNTRWQAPWVHTHTHFAKVAYPNWKSGLRDHPSAQNTSEQEVCLRRRAERPELWAPTQSIPCEAQSSLIWTFCASGFQV